MDRFAGLAPEQQNPRWPKKLVRVIYAPYDLTFLREFSEGVLREFRARRVNFDAKILPCGHYTTGETPYKYIDGWYLGSFVYNAFKKLAEEQRADNSSTPVHEAVQHERVF
jgi:hypothetical protein